MLFLAGNTPLFTTKMRRFLLSVSNIFPACNSAGLTSNCFSNQIVFACNSSLYSLIRQFNNFLTTTHVVATNADSAHVLRGGRRHVHARTVSTRLRPLTMLQKTLVPVRPHQLHTRVSKHTEVFRSDIHTH